MNIFKAFAQIGALTDNTKDVVAPIGELSPLSKTFSRVLTEDVDGSRPNLTLVGFSYKVDGVYTVPAAPMTTNCLEIIDWVYSTARAGTFTEQKDSFQQAFIAKFGNKYDLVNSGKMVAFGPYFAPEYVETAPYQQSATNQWRLWFSDDSFFNQYDEFEILVVPPITPIDQFFGDFDEVSALIDKMSMTDILSKVTVAKGKFPETYLRSDIFNWQEPTDHTLIVPTEWTTVIYGAAGNNLDSVKEAIRDYILANSSKGRDDWAEIFPDLFTSTEFIITPMWNDYSKPNSTRELGIYSGIVEPDVAKLLVRKTCKGVRYTQAHIDTHQSVVPTQFKSLMTVVVGGPENRNGVDMFRERYPQYMNVPLTNVDFGLMDEPTRKFITLLSEMLLKAESLTLDSGVPQGFNRTKRDGIVYLSTTFDGFLWLVVTKQSVVASYPLGA